MLTAEEKDFVRYWEDNRLKKQKILKQLYVGLPLATLLVVSIFANFFTNWYKKAEMVRNEATQKNNSSLILVLVIAAILIVVFITIFGARHRWDQQEQRYRELRNRTDL